MIKVPIYSVVLLLYSIIGEISLGERLHLSFDIACYNKLKNVLFVLLLLFVTLSF